MTSQPSRTGRVIALDLGEKRIGVAVTDPGRILASPYSTIHRSGDHTQDHREIAQAVAEVDAVQVVVGLPLSMSGDRGPAAQMTEKEVDELRQLLPVPIDLVDERLTTVSAARSLGAAGMSSRRQRQGGRIDQEAATVLLQSWIDRQANL